MSLICPIISFQEILRDYGTVLWMEPPEVLLTGRYNTSKKLLQSYNKKIDAYYFSGCNRKQFF
jgi:hypothetical protein